MLFYKVLILFWGFTRTCSHAWWFENRKLLQCVSPQPDTNDSISSGFDEGPPSEKRNVLWLVSCPSALWLANSLDAFQHCPASCQNSKFVNIAISIQTSRILNKRITRTFARTDIARHIKVVMLLLLLFFWAKSLFSPTDLHYLWPHIYANSFSASGRRCWSGRARGFTGNTVHKPELCSQTLLYQTLHARWNENDIQNFLKTVGFHQKYSDIKTPALGFSILKRAELNQAFSTRQPFKFL